MFEYVVTILKNKYYITSYSFVFYFFYPIFQNMSEKHVISFTMVADFFKNNIKQLQRGENSYKSGNVQNMTFDAKLCPAVLRGKVKASMKRIVYSVEVYIL